VMVVAIRMKFPKPLAAVSGAIVCFTLRIISVRHHWNLPHVHVQ